MDDFNTLVASCDYPEMGSRLWFDRLWGRAFGTAIKAGWTFRQALRLAEGQHLCVFPRDLFGMPTAEDDWHRCVGDVPGNRLIGPDPTPADPLADCEMFNVPATRWMPDAPPVDDYTEAFGAGEATADEIPF